MSQAVHRLAKGDPKFHLSKLHNRSAPASGGVANLAQDYEFGLRRDGLPHAWPLLSAPD